MSAPEAAPSLECVMSRLLEVTEAIHAGLLGSGDLDGTLSAYERRERLFEELRVATEAGEAWNAASRACLDRVRVLDAEILAVGGAQSDEIRDERVGLQRRRSAIAAHTTREREAPRLITLKA